MNQKQRVFWLVLGFVSLSSCGKSTLTGSLPEGGTPAVAPVPVPVATGAPGPTAPNGTTPPGAAGCAAENVVYYEFTQPSSGVQLTISLQAESGISDVVAVSVDGTAVTFGFSGETDILSLAQADAGHPGSVIEIEACSEPQKGSNPPPDKGNPPPKKGKPPQNPKSTTR